MVALIVVALSELAVGVAMITGDTEEEVVGEIEALSEDIVEVMKVELDEISEEVEAVIVDSEAETESALVDASGVVGVT